MGKNLELNLFGFRNARRFLGEVQGFGESSQFVHKSQGLSVFSCPDAPLGDLQDTFFGEPTPFGHLTCEIDIYAVKPALEARPLRLWVVLGSGPHCRIGSDMYFIPGEAYLIPQA